MLRYILSLFSPRGLSIQILLVCLLSVDVFTLPMEQVPGGSTAPHSTSSASITTTYDIFIGEHRLEPGKHPVLLRFHCRAYHEDFYWGLENPLRADSSFQFTHIGQAGFEGEPEAARQAFEHAKQYAAEQLQHYPRLDRLNEWRYPRYIMQSLHHYLVDGAMKNWQDMLPLSLRAKLTRGQDIDIVECYTNFGTRLRGVVPETYLWIGDLLISLDQTQFVPSTGLDQVLSNRGRVLHSLGKIQTDLDLDQILMHVDSANLNFFTAHDYEGNAKQVEIWTQKENKWSEADEAAEAIARGAQGKSIEKFSTSLKRWKFSDGFIYALWVNKAITDEQFKRWVTNIRVQCVDRLVTRTDTRISSRKKQLKKLQPSTDVELPPQ
ncbi:hypothetical protein C8R42DRAFT_729637 [Lentinula raphanica]|nr:hypothetical protein C8R42DRAFT_729637 [Lentinula raphanica]